MKRRVAGISSGSLLDDLCRSPLVLRWPLEDLVIDGLGLEEV
jgi:hypothetical protein